MMNNLFKLDEIENVKVLVKKAEGEKCPRCWKIFPGSSCAKDVVLKITIYEKNYNYFILYFFDRFVKLYLINLQTNGTDIDFYIFHF